MSLGPSCWLVYSSTEVPGSLCLSPLHELFSPWTTLHNLLTLSPAVPVSEALPQRSLPSSSPSNLDLNPLIKVLITFMWKAACSTASYPHSWPAFPHMTATTWVWAGLSDLPPMNTTWWWTVPSEMRLPKDGGVYLAQSFMFLLTLSLVPCKEDQQPCMLSVVSEKGSRGRDPSLWPSASEELSLWTTTRVSWRCHGPSDLNHRTQLRNTHTPDPEAEK